MDQDQQSQDTIMQPHMYPTASPPPPTVAVQAAPASAPVIVQMAAPSQVGPKPSLVTCSTCQKSVLTNVKYKAVGKTHMWACFLCICGCWPCAFLPYVMKTCRNADHYCPGCNGYVGVYNA